MRLHNIGCVGGGERSQFCVLGGAKGVTKWNPTTCLFSVVRVAEVLVILWSGGSYSGVDEGTNADGSAASAVALVPLVEAMEVDEAAVGRCDVESTEAVGGGDE
ncbi:hypothetical protein TSMEX_002070 [Taenia solium]|eukprot:TsM_001041100 transcript=TsM_001041100 gene=TsM_001041100